MNATTLIWFGLLSGVVGLSAAALTSGKARQSTAESFLVPRDSLGRSAIVNLLLSSSFGVNALLYAAWLGYSVGAWGLLIQLAWTLSFVFLAPFASRVRSLNSLHQFLGARFGASTRVWAAVCTLVGFIYLMGWEIAIGESTIAAVLPSAGATPSSGHTVAAAIVVGIVLGTLLYTILGGLRGNATVDSVLNAVKIAAIVLLIGFLVSRLASLPTNQVRAALFPSFDTMKQNLGILGLATNIVFNLAWQFVDNSSWQTVTSGTNEKATTSSQNLRTSGLLIFVTIGTLGTLFGVAMTGARGITSDNILAQAATLFPAYNGLLRTTLFVIVVGCMMSLLDGYFLSSAFTLGLDVLSGGRGKESGASGPAYFSNLGAIRILLLLIALLALWGVRYVFHVLNANLFDFVYVVILTQLALFGPVIVGLASDRQSRGFMWTAIAGGLVAGFGAAAVGSLRGPHFLLDGAGLFTLAASTVIAVVVSRTGNATTVTRLGSERTHEALTTV